LVFSLTGQVALEEMNETLESTFGKVLLLLLNGEAELFETQFFSLGLMAQKKNEEIVVT
jgi:hypothetical protein